MLYFGGFLHFATTFCQVCQRIQICLKSHTNNLLHSLGSTIYLYIHKFPGQLCFSYLVAGGPEPCGATLLGAIAAGGIIARRRLFSPLLLAIAANTTLRRALVARLCQMAEKFVAAISHKNHRHPAACYSLQDFSSYTCKSN